MQNAIENNLTEPATREQPVPRLLRVSSHGVTDRGQERPQNEDQFVISEVRRVMRVEQSSIAQPENLLGDVLGHILVVADGIGGHRGGEYASALAVVGIENLLLNTIGWLCQLQGDGVQQELTEALRAADRWVDEAAGRRPDLAGMGTTLTMAYVSGSTLYVAHAGDSRCYLWRQGCLERLTRDHTLVESLVDDGVLTPEAAANHQMRNVVTNAVGGGTRAVEPEVHKHALQPGDQVVLCTDGLTGTIDDEELAAYLGADQPPAQTCQRLVDEANRRGGPDNITVVIARFDEAEEKPAPATVS
jgi:serine/threonine protein phosphatase PrpC